MAHQDESDEHTIFEESRVRRQEDCGDGLENWRLNDDGGAAVNVEKDAG